MKQKLLILIFMILLVGLLVGLNAVSYVQKEKTPDNEMTPNRSTYNSGATGTQALYSLLAETGRNVTRWQEAPDGLLTAKGNTPKVFVLIGAVRREFADVETEQLLRWVAAGGRLVLIDREPPAGLVTTTANWQIKPKNKDQFAVFNIDPSDAGQMISETAAVKPVQPTTFTRGVNAVQPSRFASSIGFERFSDVAEPVSKRVEGKAAPPLPPPPSEDDIESPSQRAPVVHFASAGQNLVVDAPFGEGRIVYLGDPFIVSNGGISLVDNAQLAVNLVSAGDGLIAFDEYHQGYGTNNNHFLQFFEGTPIIAIFLQAIVLAVLVFFSQSRRFARPVPEPEPDRLSKLEYVSAMAELQDRTRAYDLAIENIYTDFRRRSARLLGVDNYTVTHNELARLIAARSGEDLDHISDTLLKCEEIIRGEPTNKREVLVLTSALRFFEKKLGMTRAAKAKI